MDTAPNIWHLLVKKCRVDLYPTKYHVDFTAFVFPLTLSHWKNWLAEKGEWVGKTEIQQSKVNVKNVAHQMYNVWRKLHLKYNQIVLGLVFLPLEPWGYKVPLLRMS
jgi:hypothetical protein